MLGKKKKVTQARAGVKARSAGKRGPFERRSKKKTGGEEKKRKSVKLTRIARIVCHDAPGRNLTRIPLWVL